MKRRYARNIVFAAMLGAGVTHGDLASAQQSADEEGVRAASKAFYEALAVLDDNSKMEKVWVKEPFVTYASPSSKAYVYGWDALEKVWAGNDRYAKREVSVKDAKIHVVGSLAWEMGYETGQVLMKDGTAREIDGIVTNVYEKVDGRWLMVSHHTSQRSK
jgi:ketosteroid isomerase-like protein